MNKTDLINAINSASGLNKTNSKKAIEAFIETISKELSKGNNVRISALGTFKVVKKAARNGIIPSTKAVIKIPAKKVVKFTVAKELAETVK